MARLSPQARLYLFLSVFPVLLAVPRLFTGPWYLTHSPHGARLLDGMPIAWEATYYLMHFTRFLGDVQPPEGVPFTSIQYRTWPNLFLATSLHAVLGSPFWSMAIVDWVFWVLGGITGHQVARRLGASPLAAALAAIMIVGAPIFACSVWRVDLRLGNSASMAIGLWAALALFDDAPRPPALALGLGGLLVWLGLNYQYQYIIGPMLLVLVLRRPRQTWTTGLLTLAGAFVIYVAGTFALRTALNVILPLPPGETSTIVASAEEMLTARLSNITSVEQLFGLLPSWYHTRLTVQAYHPMVFVACLLGLFSLRPEARWLALVASAATAITLVFYPYPWVAMSAYPILYAGAGLTCVSLGGFVVARVKRWLPAAHGAAFERYGAATVAIVCATALVAVTNLDLFGDPTFYLRWWTFWETMTF